MIVYIVLALVLAATLYVIWMSWWTEFFETIIGGIFATIGIVLVGALVAALGVGITALIGASTIPLTPDGTSQTEKLVALQTRDTVEGKYVGGIFASYGYVDGKRVLSYTTQRADGGFELGYVAASASVVYQGTRTPTLKTIRWHSYNPWVAPFEVGEGHTYELHVPTGSVVENFQVAP